MAAEGEGNAVVPEIPDDSLTTSIAEMSELDVLLTSIEKCANQLLGALSQLQSAPSPLLSDLERCYSNKSSCGQLLDHLVRQLNACVSRLACGIPHLEGLVQLVDQVRPQVDIARDAVAARRAAWEAKQRSEQPVKGCRIEEKRSRMKAKHDADELFARTTHEATRIVDHLLSQRWPITGTALTELCHCYAGMFASTPSLANELRKSAAKLKAMSTIFEEPPYGCGSCRNLKSRPATSWGGQGSAGHEKEDPYPQCQSGEHAGRGPGGRGQGDEGPRRRTLVTPPSMPEKPGTATPEKPGSAASTRSGTARGGGAATPPATATPERPGAATGTRSAPAGFWGAATSPATSAKPGAAAFTRSGSARGGGAAPPPATSGAPGGAAGVWSGFAKGEAVEVWSRSQGTWVEAVVQAIFDVPGQWENYVIPAGVIKVESAVGVKFIRPDQIEDLRKPECFAV